MNKEKKVTINITAGEKRENQAQKLKEFLERKGYDVQIFVAGREEGFVYVLDTDSVLFGRTRIPFSYAYEHAEELF